MIRNIIKFDEVKCNGCGLCITACQEGAIALVDGKAKLLRDDYCDGLGNCLPVCPCDAISFEEREAAAFDEEAVIMNMQLQQSAKSVCGCPGTQAKALQVAPTAPSMATITSSTQLLQWPVQMKLVPVNAYYFENANLLVSADCAAYAYGNFHNKFMKNKVTIIGCPKLDQGDYAEKLTEILTLNNIKSITAVRMEVPCCGGIEQAVKTAIQHSGKIIPWRVVQISTNGRILED